MKKAKLTIKEKEKVENNRLREKKIFSQKVIERLDKKVSEEKH